MAGPVRDVVAPVAPSGPLQSLRGGRAAPDVAIPPLRRRSLLAPFARREIASGPALRAGALAMTALSDARTCALAMTALGQHPNEAMTALGGARTGALAMTEGTERP